MVLWDLAFGDFVLALSDFELALGAYALEALLNDTFLIDRFWFKLPFTDSLHVATMFPIRKKIPPTTIIPNHTYK